MGKTVSKVSLGDIAKLAGTSKSTVSYVLRNQPGPSPATRERVLAVAKKLGYFPDARVVSWMAQIRDANSKNLLPIAWVDTNWEKDSWEKHKFLSPYLEGATARAQQLGYRIEKIWAGQPGMTMRRVSQIIYQRGIEGVIVTHQVNHIRLAWDQVASVALEGRVLAPSLHRVMTDYTFNLLLALKMLRRYGYRRIGICLDRLVGSNTYNTCRVAASYFQASLPKAEIVPPLFYVCRDRGSNRDEIRKNVEPWLRRHRPEVVVGHDNGLLDMVESAGFQVPAKVGVVHLATDDDVSDWAGINSKRREIGAAAAAWLISMMQNRQFGLPATPMNIEIRGTWHPGRTLIAPKSA